MLVGPSAAPMMPMALAVLRSKPSSTAIIMVTKMPNWAAAPKKIMDGFLNSGAKSIIAPTAMKMRMGKSSVSMPASNRICRKPACPSWPRTTARGRFARMAPKPMGRSSMGSYSLLTASQIRTNR
jgi:hypothetical protein